MSIEGIDYYAFECEGKVYRSELSVNTIDRLGSSTAAVCEADDAVAATLRVQAVPGHLVYFSHIDRFSIHMNRLVSRR